MLNGMGLTRGLSFVKILGGLSKTLQVANQIIPLYQKAKPAIQNARNMLGILKEMSKPDTKQITTNSNNQSAQIDNTPKEKTSQTPTFFL